MSIVRRITSLELIHFYEGLVREKKKEFASAGRFGKAFQKKKEIFKKLIDTLGDRDIPPKEFILAQFETKGYRPYPSQLLTEKAFQRWEEWRRTYIAREIHRVQENYLERLKSIGYSVEEALALDMFYYYFRRLHLKRVPKAWHMYADVEIERTPGLKTFLKRKEAEL